MTTLIQDVRYAIRTLAKAPAFAAIALATIALGIGANTAIFSVVRAVLLKRLPYPEPQRLVVLRERDARGGEMGVAWPNFLDWREQSRAFANLAGFRATNATLSATAEPQLLRIGQVSPSFFPILGVGPALGRSFTEADDRPGAPATVLLADALWRDRFGADPSVVGKTVRLDAQPHTIVGVLPPSFGFFPERVDLYVPVGLQAGKAAWLERGNHWGMRVLARLAPGTTLSAARTEMDTIMARLEQAYPKTNSGHRASVLPLADRLFGSVRTPLWILLGAVGLVLLIACANVAHLQLARAAGRRREIAIRAAIGASRGRIARQLLTESLLLSAVGGALGLCLALWAIGPLLSLAPPEIPRLAETRIDPGVLLFTLIASMLTGTLFGLAPAVQASRCDPQAALKDGSHTASSGGARQRLRSALFVSEVALAFVLVIGAGLLIRSLLYARSVPPGFRAEGVLALDVALPDAKYGDKGQRHQFFSRAVDEIRSLPGVASASAVYCPPTVGRCWGSVYVLSDRPAPAQPELPDGAFNVTEPAYFRTMQIPLLQGRLFTEADTATAPPVVIINETMARRWWPNESPLGKRVKQGFPQDEGSFREIVGVVGDVRQHGLEGPVETEVYLPEAQNPEPSMTLVARTDSPARLALPAAKAIHFVDPEQSVSRVQPMEEYLAESVAGRRSSTLLLGIFGALALLLASVGIYGVVSHGVAQRTREIGIRTALGARPADVLRLVLSRALRLAALGMAIGGAAALGVTRLLAKLLFGVGPSDPLTFVGVTALLTAVVLLACLWPARRALHVDPNVALRQE